MQTERKRSILKTVGIEVWQNRSSEKKEQGSVFHFLPLSKELCILADYSFSKATDEKNLLEAIAKALGYVIKSEIMTENQLIQDLPEYKKIILMSENCVTNLSSSTIIRTFSPLQLLENSQLKAQTWQSIRHLKIA